jgi:hypothetical protein
MKISKLLSAVCLLAGCAGFFPVHADDTAAQAAARAALLNAMAGQAPQAAPAKKAPETVQSSGTVTPATAQTNSVPAPVTKPVAEATAAQTPAAAPAPAPLDTEAQARARAALLQAMGLPQTEPPAAAPAPAAIAVVPTPATVKPAPPVAKPVAPTPSGAGVNRFATEPGYTPIVAPPLPISPAKQQQLQALLVKYEANQISPEEYHQERAAILAAP